ncbi:Alcohol dehydrogenase, zinc-binding protein [Rubrobacter xylanophilus DSM 9941]|uniref:Alcohol dehydrogenase, zinc-binding protein n=1 Tax=Rubrobacter xylanophilus (strain DSM 9941 / JCM 11954 / NBRC 16129 / PRD-1) TaxID=266117 RepID=Q1ARB8_RUBXD|nr:NDMA-dependent alcohol dehydrogenase [Rubrobacter xylanophilus]ABG06060.1 Alcohol dehydrogenase, zinc-binding protein [Rubrobacter xylanophilus DSM 9941]
MKSRAALLYGEGQEFRVEEIEVDDPKQNEVLVHLAATGLCHSDYHMVTGEYGPLHFPMIGGHEGAGVVEKVGPGVTRVSPGDHVLLTFIPACGHCRFCSMGLSFLCDRGAAILQGPQLDGTFRMHTADGQDAGQFCCISTFSEYTVVPEASIVPIDRDLDLTKVCIVGCCVPTGFGSAVNKADVQPGETVVVFGIGGVGINAVQGAAVKGASKVVAVDPVDFKLETAEELGATHTINPNERDPVQTVVDLTNGVGADKAIITIDNVLPEHVGQAFKAIRKGGRVVVTGVARYDHQHIDVPPYELTLFAKEVVGTMYGDSPVNADLARYLELYRTGKLKVDELITRTYSHDEINQGYRDMLDGKNIRGVIVYDWAR